MLRDVEMRGVGRDRVETVSLGPARPSFIVSPLFLMAGFGFSRWKFWMGVFDYVAIGRDVGLILARRVDTWDDPYD
ncbi:MAG TPA: hypothetical protein DDZ90_34845 [Planctomycetaceae bacterium]|nr:hypothetical protein [Gimesia sp.]HBL48574.1 hypothetical protein [Planctomycetaceae bacterium]